MGGDERELLVFETVEECVEIVAGFDRPAGGRRVGIWVRFDAAGFDKRRGEKKESKLTCYSLCVSRKTMASHVVYFDESGDHGLAKIDPAFPVFVLCGCLYRVEDYIGRETAAFSKIKFQTFGHDAVVFHSRDIRKRLGDFKMFQDDAKRVKFMADVAGFFRKSQATIVAAAIDKRKLADRYRAPEDPYEIALLFCLERLSLCLQERGCGDEPVTCVFEQRGPKEDAQLASAFVRIANGANMIGPLPFRVVFASKLANMPGLQIADLAAYPIARKVINPGAANASFDAVEARLRKSPAGKASGWGLKVFP